MRAGEAASTEEVAIKVRLVAPPLYVMSTTSTDKTAAIEVMEKAVEAIGAKISEEKGDMVVKMKVGGVLFLFTFRKREWWRSVSKEVMVG